MNEKLTCQCPLEAGIRRVGILQWAGVGDVAAICCRGLRVGHSEILISEYDGEMTDRMCRVSLIKQLKMRGR